MAIYFIAPETNKLLILGSFISLLQVARIISQKILKVETIGFLAIGVVFAHTNLLPPAWQESFLAVGYLGLIILVFEGALFTNTELLTRNFSLSLVCAATGVAGPIGLSLLLLPSFGYSTIQAFASGAALSATSLGTTVAVFKAGSTSPQFTWFSARVTTVLLSAATIDDVIGLVIASVMPSLGMDDSSTIGWAIGRPVLASVGLVIITFMITYLLQFVRFKVVSINWVLEKHHTRARFLCIVACLTALTSAAAYAGTSILFGAFAAGIILAYADTTNENPPSGAPGGEAQARLPYESFRTVFQQTISPVQDALFAPLFFASIGFATPFRDLWKAVSAWQGITYAILMVLGKLIVGVWIPVWTRLWWRDTATGGKGRDTMRVRPKHAMGDACKAGVLLGSGMVARGEIGLLIVQLGYNSGRGPIPYDLYIVAIWALILNTIVGPIMVALTLSRWRNPILKGAWGISDSHSDDVAVTSFEGQEMPRINM